MPSRLNRELWPGEDQAHELMEEIASLERRLRLMGVDGDCAYERAISRLYLGMVEERRQQLAELQVRPF